MADQGPRRFEDERDRDLPDVDNRNQGGGGLSIKHAIIVMIIGIGITFVLRTAGRIYNVPRPIQKIVPSPDPGSGPGVPKPEEFMTTPPPPGPVQRKSYEAQAELMQKAIKRYASIQRAGVKNDTSSGGASIVGRTTGTFKINSDDLNKKESDETDEENVEPLDNIDLSFVDGLIEDIQETESSKEKSRMRERINELEKKLGRTLTKFRMTPEELDADTSLGEFDKQNFEFHNLRQGFVDIWVKRLRQLKELNDKYFRLPDQYTMLQKRYLKKNFEDYVSRYWDNDKNRVKRDKITTPHTSHPPKDPKEAKLVVTTDEDNLDKEIQEILEAVHFTPEYETKQELEEELEELKRMQGLPAPKVSGKEYIKNNFIAIQRENNQMNGFVKKSPKDYSLEEIEELKEMWEEYYEFHKSESAGDGELELDELEEVDDLIEGIERTPNYVERENLRKRLEKENEDRSEKTFLNSEDSDEEENEFDMSYAKMFDNVHKSITKMKYEFVAEERARLLGPEGDKSKPKPDPLFLFDDDEEDNVISEESDAGWRESYREPQEYSLAEKVELKKRFDLFMRRFMSQRPLKDAPRETRDLDEISSDLEKNELDYLEDLIVDIHQIESPAHEARLDIESVTAKLAKMDPNDRVSQLNVEVFELRRKFIAQERARLVCELTQMKGPFDYTYEEKEELRSRWVDYYETSNYEEKDKELAKLLKARRIKKEQEKGIYTKETEEEPKLFNDFAAELVLDLLDEIYDQHNFSLRKTLMTEYDETTRKEFKRKQQLYQEQERFSMKAEDKLIQEFTKKSLSEFLTMRNEFLKSEKALAKKNGRNSTFIPSDSDKIELLNRWKVKFREYKTKVDELFKTLGN